MKIYRKSKFHNAKNGRFLARILDLHNKINKVNNVIKEINNVVFDLDLSQVIDSSLYYSGSFEPKSEEIIRKYLTPGMKIIDIGANIGYHTFYMAKLVGPEGLVYAIEPTNWAIKKIKKNLSLNPSINNVIIAQLCLSDKSLGIQRLSFQSSYRLDNHDERELESVEVLTLDDFIRNFGIEEVDFVKLDVDGFEGKILDGALECIKRNRPIILFELNPTEIVQTDHTVSGIFELLENFGYQLYDDDLRILNKIKLQEKMLDENQSLMVFALPRFTNYQ